MLFSASRITVAKRGRAPLDDFLKMGGYAAYVWPAYAISALGLGGLVFAIWRRGRDLKRKLKDLEETRSGKDGA